MKALRNIVDKIKPTFSKGGKLGFLHSTFDAFETFLFVPNTTTQHGTHVRDCNDIKRTMITVIPEGDNYELLGWAMPRFKKFSVSRAYFSWLFPCRKYNLDTNLNGGERAFVMNDLYEKYLPMDIYPVHLVKACLAGDLDKMENLGIYEVVEEDLALCEFVCPSKIEIQQILRNGINTMIKEEE